MSHASEVFSIEITNGEIFRQYDVRGFGRTEAARRSAAKAIVRENYRGTKWTFVSAKAVEVAS